MLAKAAGDGFEMLFFHTCMRHGITAIHIPPGCKNVKTKMGVVLKRVKTPFDFMLTNGAKVAFVDAKTKLGKTFCFSDLTHHQVHILKSLEDLGHKTGYVVAFRELDKVVFFSSSKLSSLRKRDSLSPEDGEYLGRVNSFSLGGFW